MNLAVLLIAWTILMTCWIAWAYPFIFRAPHHQKRPSITLTAPTRAGLLLESLAIFIAFACRLAPGERPGTARLVASLLLGAIAGILSWTSVTHLGRQFRVNAGLYEDHQLVRTGPYAIVRHPIYSSLFAILLSTICVLTRWDWAILSIALFVAGTEIRVHAEDGLLASRFGEDFARYKSQVPAYVPFLR
ncbi:MAG TPA: isoprenylcysteine carboxylmethyltransferase family protein [Candidatus Solibacter sp.]|nr:isoprenylcysteine carboxylmethyltransferase family protein [Candidatus Solibacter sp.]